MSTHEAIDPYIREHVKAALDLHQTLRLWHEEHAGETCMVLMEGAIRGLQEAMEARLSQRMSSLVWYAERRAAQVITPEAEATPSADDTGGL